MPRPRPSTLSVVSAVYESCPCCGGKIESPHGSVLGVCLSCKALVGVVGYKEDHPGVKLDEPMIAESDSPRYFDFTYPILRKRVHGWFDQLTGRVLQYG